MILLIELPLPFQWKHPLMFKLLFGATRHVDGVI